jgi:hypothetical protein
VPRIKLPVPSRLQPIQFKPPKDFSEQILAVEGQSPLAEAVSTFGKVAGEGIEGAMKKRQDLALLLTAGKQMGLDEPTIRSIAQNPEMRQTALKFIQQKQIGQQLMTPQEREMKGLEARKTTAEAAKLEAEATALGQPQGKTVMTKSQALEAAKKGMLIPKDTTIVDDAEGIGTGKVNIPGLNLTGEVSPKPEEAVKLRQASAEFQTFQQDLNSYRDLIKKYGTQERSKPAVQAEMNAKAKKLQLSVKNMAQLGILSASDVPFIVKQIPDPGFFQFSEGMLGALDSTEESMFNTLKNSLEASGYSITPDFFEKIRPKKSLQPLPMPQASGAPAVGQQFNGQQVVRVKKVR